MKIEFNIGLAIEGQDNSHEAQEDRASRAVDLLGHLFGFSGLRTMPIQASDYVGPDGEIVEQTLVGELDLGRVDVVSDLVKQRFHYVSIELGQECIAVYIPETNRGMLIGPLAARWGAFNLEFFKRFSDVY